MVQLGFIFAPKTYQNRVLEASWSVWERLGGLLGRLERILERLGLILERLGGFLERFGRVLGRLGAKNSVLRRLGRV